MFRVSLYGSQPVGWLGLSAVLTYAHAWNNTQRATGLNHASSSNGTTDVSGGVQAAVPFNFGPVLLTPAAGILVSGVSGGSFAEDVRRAGARTPTGEVLPTWKLFLEHPAYDEPWSSRGVEHHLTKVAVPTLTVGGYYDQ